MTIARSRLVSTQTTVYYHLISRCVRRAFLCGSDPLSGQDYEHRRQWVVDRLAKLADLFAIEVLAYAVMSNHYHLVIRLRPEWADQWNDEEVIERWSKLYGVPPLLARYRKGECQNTEHNDARALLATRRQRLACLSWFMKCLNEPIARRANAEDHCTGVFWEGRFKSRALLNKRALLSCMAYVDLNPVRAKMATTPETSDYTSVQARIQRQHPLPLAPFIDESSSPDNAVPFELADYLTLVDLTGRRYAKSHRGTISDALPPLLKRLEMDQNGWERAVKLHRFAFHVMGSPEEVRVAAQRLAQKWFRGVRSMGVFSKN